MAWQKATAYGQRTRIETEVGRYKQVIGPEMRSRILETQTTKTKIAVKALNRMTHLAVRPMSVSRSEPAKGANAA